MTLPYEPAARLSESLLHDHVVRRIWDRDVSVWRADAGSDAARSIASRLGWLDIAQTMPPHVDRLTALASSGGSEQIETVFLLGMGGSSLCAEVIRTVHGIASGFPKLVVLDTTDEQTLDVTAKRLNPARSLFVVASKSGGTVEVASMERFFWARMSAALGDAAGRHFLAITDPDTALQTLASTRGYRDTFINPADIGGRFSALSLFGLVPTALVGASVRDMLAAGSAMAEGCRQENHANAGLELGAFLGAAALAGRDKLTVVLPPSLSTLGLWIEQLVAESTGKHGKGILPVVDEPLGRPEDYGQDRAFVAFSTDRDAPDAEALSAIEHADHPMLRLTTRVEGLGSEFFRWEFATAVAAAAIGINPFDEPNVAEAKAKTKALLDTYLSTGTLSAGDPLTSDDTFDVFTRGFAGSDPAAVVSAALDSLQPGDYVAFLSYLPASPVIAEAINGVRVAIRARSRTATTLGIGPRYLHSTGQYHKGGPNTVLAFVLTAEDRTRSEVPEAGYTFSVLKRAQALGDVQTLEAHGRRVVRLHLKQGEPEAAIARLFADALRPS
jgi:transaldolase/glucose-6-phosphate isomerase